MSFVWGAQLWAHLATPRAGFGVSCGCFSSTAAHRVGMLTCRNPGPVPWLPPPHCFTLCWVWAAEDKQVKCLRLSSRALPLQSSSWAKAVEKAQPGQQQRVAQQSDLRAFSRVDEPVSNTHLSKLLPHPSSPILTPRKRAAGFYQVNHTGTHITLLSSWGKAKGAEMSFQGIPARGLGADTL